MQFLRQAVVLSVLAVVPVARATAGPASSHPYFDDSGTLAWSSSLPAAQAAARSQGKLIFIESGRLQCRNCRILVQKVLPTACIRDRMSTACIGLAADCDQPDPRVSALFERNLPNAAVLPLVGFVTADLQWITGWSGGATADVVQTHLSKAESVLARSAKKVEPAPAPCARPTATLASAPAPEVAQVEKARTCLEKARRAATTGQWGEVVRLQGESDKLPVRVDPTEWKSLAAKAKTWCEETLVAALTAAKEGRADEAARLLAKVRKEMPVETEAAQDATRGETALTRLKEVAAAQASEDVLLCDATRRAALAELKDSRWAVLFNG